MQSRVSLGASLGMKGHLWVSQAMDLASLLQAHLAPPRVVGLARVLGLAQAVIRVPVAKVRAARAPLAMGAVALGLAQAVIRVPVAKVRAARAPLAMGAVAMAV